MEKIWKELESSFTEWEVHHTGGGMFALRKDFSDVNGNSVMVTLSDEFALVTKNINDSTRLITHREFLDNEDIYWDGEDNNRLYEEVFVSEEGRIKETDRATALFDANIRQEIQKAMKRVEVVLWSDRNNPQE